MPTKKELQEQLQELQLHHKKMLTVIADLRMRNSELANLLTDEQMASVTPMQIPHSRYNRIFRLVDLAIDWANTSSPHKLSLIREQADSIQNYLSEYFDNRKVLTEEQIEKMQSARKANRSNA